MTIKIALKTARSYEESADSIQDEDEPTNKKKNKNEKKTVVPEVEPTRQGKSKHFVTQGQRK